MKVIITPGTGAIVNTSEENAVANIQQFIEDLNTEGVTFEKIPFDDKGRYSFDLLFDGRCVEVDMPGLPLEKVRYIDENSQNIWDFPRLYVGGSSWVWKYAVEICKDVLIENKEEN